MGLCGQDQLCRVATLLCSFCSTDEARLFLSAVSVVEKNPRKWCWKKWPTPVDVKVTEYTINIFNFPSNKKRAMPASLQLEFLEVTRFNYHQLGGVRSNLAVKGVL